MVLISFGQDFAIGDQSCGDCDQWYTGTDPSYQDDLDQIESDQEIINSIQWKLDNGCAINCKEIEQATHVYIDKGRVVLK